MQEALSSRLAAIHDLSAKYALRQLWVFGSVCTERFGEESDIDFLAEFDYTDCEDYADRYFFFCEELEKIIGRPADVLTPNALSNPYFIKSVENSKVLIYERGNQKIKPALKP